MVELPQTVLQTPRSWVAVLTEKEKVFPVEVNCLSVRRTMKCVAKVNMVVKKSPILEFSDGTPSPDADIQNYVYGKCAFEMLCLLVAFCAAGTTPRGRDTAKRSDISMTLGCS